MVAADEHAVLPRVRLEHERHGGGAPAAEEERRDRHALRVLPLGGDRRALRRGRRRSASSGARPGVSDSGVHDWPFQSVRCAGGSSVQVLPPHVAVVGERGVGEHGVGVHACGSAFGFEFSLVPGATPKNPNSGLMACRRPSSPNFIHAMSSPIVSTFQPGMVGMSIARLVLPHADGNAAAMYVHAALGARDLQDQHVLGEPALVARDHRRDAQREALLAEQRVAAVARAVRPDLARLGEVHDPLLVGVARPRDVVLARRRAARRPSARTGRTRRRGRARRARPGRRGSSCACSPRRTASR